MALIIVLALVLVPLVLLIADLARTMRRLEHSSIVEPQLVIEAVPVPDRRSSTSKPSAQPGSERRLGSTERRAAGRTELRVVARRDLASALASQAGPHLRPVPAARERHQHVAGQRA